jgi:hypothetical protein
MGYYTIKLSGIYKISIGDYYYIGQSKDIYTRFNSHYNDLYLNKHSSTKLQEKFNQTNITHFKFEILEHISKTEFKKEFNLKGKQFENKFRTYLLKRERHWMSQYSINFCLNKDDKYFN